MSNKYTAYKILWTVYHEKHDTPHYCYLSGVVKARNIAEALKKSEKRKSTDIPKCLFEDWYIIKPSTIYIVNSNAYYTFVEGFWRKCWGMYFHDKN